MDYFQHITSSTPLKAGEPSEQIDSGPIRLVPKRYLATAPNNEIRK